MRLAILILAIALGGHATADQLNPSPDSIPAHAKVIKQNVKPFMECYQRELKRDPRVAKGGKVVLAVALDKDGGVKSTRVESTSLNNKSVEDCLLRAMMTLKFPSEAPRTFSFPFQFASQ